MSYEICNEQVDKLYGSRNLEIVDLLLRGYPTDPSYYHIRSHGEETIERSLANRSVMQAYGIPVESITVTMVGAAGHDVLKFEYDSSAELQKLFSSAEEYAEFTIKNTMLLFEYDKDTSERTAKSVLPTRAGVEAKTPTEIGLVFADVETTTEEDTTPMFNDTSKLRLEYALNKPDLGEIGYKVLSIGILATINNVNMGNGLVDKIPEFVARRKQMKTNIDIMANDVADQAGQELKNIIQRVKPPFIDRVLQTLGIRKEEIKLD